VPLEFINVISEVDDGYPIDRIWTRHQGITIHRVGYDHLTGIDLGATAVEICAHFTGTNSRYPEVAKATGGQLAYTIMIGKKGEVWQCLPLGDVGHHARRWSSRTIGVAVIGDPRKFEVPHAQYWALVDTCSLIARVLGTSSNQIKGHDERHGARRDRRKRCPGRHLKLSQLRYDVHMVMRHTAELKALHARLVP